MPKLERLVLSRSAMDRATEHRTDPEWVAARWADPRCQVLVLDRDRAPVTDDRGALRFVDPAELGTPPERCFLGLDEEGAPYFAVQRDAQPDLDGAHNGTANLREAAATLSDRDAGLFVHAVALANWHASHRFCARCGTVTSASAAGDLRRCPSCAAEHYPRTDPAIIVLVHDDADRCLLGHNAQWPAGRFSTLAGFVEPGESLEAAVVREVHEESGVVVADPEYAGSQPWPFPSSLMLGYFARAVSTEITVDGEEIAEARWFSREELRAAIDSGEVLAPSGVSIARQLIETWYGDTLPGST